MHFLNEHPLTFNPAPIICTRSTPTVPQHTDSVTPSPGFIRNSPGETTRERVIQRRLLIHVAP